MKNTLVLLLICVALLACEGNSDPFDDNGIDHTSLDKTRAKIDSLPSVIRKDYLKSDSLFQSEAKKEISLLKEEIEELKEEIKKLKKGK